MTATTQMRISENANVKAWARGTYTYRSTETSEWRGEDDWTVTLNSDGTRTMRMFSLVQETGVMRDIIYRVDVNFRPKELASSTWKDGAHTGTGVYIVQGDELTAVFSSPHGVLTQRTKVPDYFAMVPHSMASDGWYFWNYDMDRAGEQSVCLVNPHAYGTVNGSVLAQVHEDVPFEFCGVEDIEVPAGSFSAEHWRITRGNSYDVWVHGPHKTMIQLVDNTLQWGYYLSSFEQSE